MEAQLCHGRGSVHCRVSANRQYPIQCRASAKPLPGQSEPMPHYGSVASLQTYSLIASWFKVKVNKFSRPYKSQSGAFDDAEESLVKIRSNNKAASGDPGDLSGEVPQEPVVSKLTGHVYEKRLIQKYLLEEGKCPITGTPTTVDEFVALQVSKVVRPRPVATTSIPGLLASFQNEWDEVMLETFTLKQHLDTTRQELSQALYQNDAACRVIARLMRERDEARAALSQIQAAGYVNTGSSNGHDSTASVTSSAQPNNSDALEGIKDTSAMHVSTPDDSCIEEISEKVIKHINDKCKELSLNRKSRKPHPEGLLSKESISALKLCSTITPHKPPEGYITSLAINHTESDKKGKFVITGGIDKSVVISDRESGNIISLLKGHSKKVTDVALHPEGLKGAVFSCSSDKTVKIWTPSTPDGDIYTNSVTMSHHSSEVTSVTVHPRGDYIVSTSLDGTWAFLDVENNGKCLRMVPSRNDNIQSAITCGKFHPDGLIIATSTVHDFTVETDEQGGRLSSLRLSANTWNSLNLWDIRSQINVASFADHTNLITGFCFSENGYYLASGSNDKNARIFDLRKLKCLKTIEMNVPVTSVAFDYSGLYLAVAAGSSTENNTQVLFVKDWSSVLTINEVSTSITALAWSGDSSVLFSAATDHIVRVYEGAK